MKIEMDSPHFPHYGNGLKTRWTRPSRLEFENLNCYPSTTIPNLPTISIPAAPVRFGGRNIWHAGALIERANALSRQLNDARHLPLVNKNKNKNKNNNNNNKKIQQHQTIPNQIKSNQWACTMLT